MATTVFSPGSYTVSGISPAQTGIAESFQAGLQANLTRQEAQQRLSANEQLMQMRRAQEARTQAEDEYTRQQRDQERAASAELMRGFGGIGGPPATGVPTAGPIAPVKPEVPYTPRAGLATPSTGGAGTPQLFDTMQRFESAGVPTAVSPKGAVGLMQVLPSTAVDPGFGLPSVFDYARQTGVQVTGRTEADAARLLTDPVIGRGYGEAYMNAMLARYNGDVATALVAYNAGPGFTDQWLAAGANPNGLPAETRNYVANIMGALSGAPAAPAGAPAGADLRPDGSPKGTGFLGELPIRMPDGSTAVATEYSIGVNIDGTETLIPSLVPTLTPEQKSRMVEDVIPNNKKVPPDIVKAATDYARSRIQQGLSPFATDADIITTPSGVRINPNLPAPEPSKATVPTAAIAEIDRILKKSQGDDKRRVKGLKAYAEAGIRRPIEEIETELSQIQAELGAMPAASRTTREASRRDGLSKRLKVLETEFRNERQLRGLEERFPTFNITPDVPTATDFGFEAPSPEAVKAEAPTTAKEAAPTTDTTYGGVQPNYGTPVQLSFGTAEAEGEASGLYVDAPERIFKDIDTVSRQQQRLQALATYYQQTNNIEGLVGVTNQIEVLDIEQRYLDGMVAVAGIQQENFGPVQALLQQRFPGRQLEVRPYTDGTVEIFLDGQSEARITWGDLATNLRTVYDKGFIAEQKAKATEIAERSRFVFEKETEQTFQGQREIVVAQTQSELDRVKAKDQAEVEALMQDGTIELLGDMGGGQIAFQTYMNGVPVPFVYREVETRDPVTGKKTTMLSPEPLMLPSIQ